MRTNATNGNTNPEYRWSFGIKEWLCVSALVCGFFVPWIWNLDGTVRILGLASFGALYVGGTILLYLYLERRRSRR